MTFADIQPLIDWLQAHEGWVAFAIFLISFVESLAIAGVIVPGVMLLFMVAAIAGGGPLSLGSSLFWAFLGAVAGDGLSFWLGRHFNSSIATLWPVSRYPQLLDSGQLFFHKHGGKSILIGRFVGPLRPVLPLIAGMLKMQPKRFLLFNVVSAIGWAPIYILPGYLVGASISLNIQLPPHFYPTLFIALGVLATIYLLFVRLQWGLQYKSGIYDRIKKWMFTYDLTHRFWRALSNQRSVGGEFPLSSLILTVTALASLSILSLIVSHTHWLNSINLQTSQFFEILRNPLYDPLFMVITMLGDSTFLYLSFPIFITLLVFRGYYAAALHIALAGMATSLVTHGLKNYFAIPRPGLVVNEPASFAFPSGHTSGIVVFMGLFAAYIAQELPQKKRWITYGLFSMPMLLVALSRVYLGVHWLSDIIGGLLLGLAICGLTRLSYSRYDKQALTIETTTIIAMTLWLLATACYLYLGWPEAFSNYQMK